jgi:hypothetical protein
MIYAHFNRKNNNILNFTLSGHAEAGPYGHDLVCAAVSALAIGTANNLSRVADIEPEIEANEEEGGFLEIVLPDDVEENQREAEQILLRSLYHSLLDLEEEYGEYISVSQTNNE